MSDTSTGYDSLLPVQIEFIDILKNDPELSLVINGVFDEVNAGGVPEPYITIGEAIETPDNSHDRFGRQGLFAIHIWTRYRGYRQALEIKDRVIELLDHQELDLGPDIHPVATRFEFAQNLRDEDDPEVRRVLVRFRVFTEQHSRFA